MNNPEPTTTEDAAKLFNFSLVTGNILFSINGTGQEGRPDNVDTLVVSAILKSDKTNYTVSKLIKAQRNLQAVFFQKMPTDQVTIRDVVVISVSDLGWTTTDDFYAVPPEVQEAMQTLDTEVGTITEADVIRTPEDLQAALKQ